MKWTLIAMLACTTACTVGAPDLADDDGDGASGAPDDGAPEAHAASPTAHSIAAFFAVPKADGTPDGALEDKVIELARAAAPGSHVRVAMYGWTRKPVAQAFIDAHVQRGVDVQVVIDKQENLSDDDDDPATPEELDAAVQMLRAGLGTAAVTLCTRGKGSCIGDNINHNKFYTFSALSDGATHVVVQSSANLTGHHLHNNLVVFRNDPDLYAGYVDYWRDLHAKQKDLDYYRRVTGLHTLAYFFPRTDGGDTIVSVLNNVKCTSSSEIRIAMAFFSTARVAIANRLVALQHAGCDVRVVMRTAGENSSPAIISKLKAGGVKVGLYSAAHGSNIHSKYLLIDSKYDTTGQGYVRRRLVFTGSHNYLGSALENNDESLVRIDNQAVFDAFLANWKTIRAQID